MLPKKKILSALGGNVIETINGFLIIMLITRNYDQSAVGTYFIVLAIISILNNLKEGFLQNGLTKYLVEYNQSSKVERAGLILSFIGEGAKMGIFFIIALIYSPLQTFVSSFLFYTLLYSTYRWMLFVFRGRLEMKPIIQGNLMVLVVNLVGLFFIIRFHPGIEWMFVSTGVAYSASLFLISANRKLLARNLIGAIDKEMVIRMIQFGKHGFLKEVSGSIAHQAAIFISAWLLTLEATSILGLASRYTILISIPGASLAGVLFPVILAQSKNIDTLKNVAREGMGKMYAILFPMAIGIAATSPLLIYLLHGSAYLMAAGILTFKILTSAFLIPLGSGFSSIMNAINRPIEITKLMLISSSTNVIASLISIYFFGIWGAAIAPVLTELIGAYIIHKKLRQIVGFEILSIATSSKNYWVYWLKTYTIRPWKKLRYQS